MQRVRLSGPEVTVGAAGTITLATVAEAVAYLEVDQDAGSADALLQFLIDSASTAAFGMMGGRFIKEPSVDLVYAITPFNADVLYLPQYPVTRVTSLTLGNFTADGVFTDSYTLYASDYVLDRPTGRILANWPTTELSVRAAFRSGFPVVPADLKEAILQWVGVKLQRLRRSRWDATSSQSAGEAATYENELPAAARAVIRKYALVEESATR